jgi:hypothetical protein
MPALEALRTWENKAEDLIDATSAWQVENWIYFYGRAESNPRLSLANSELADVTSNFLGNLITELGGDMIKKGSVAGLAALLGTEVAPGVGTAVGFLLGVLIESFTSWAFEALTGKSEAGAAAARAAIRTSELISAKNTVTQEKSKKAKEDLRKLVSTTIEKAKKSTTQGELDKISEWAIAEAGKTKTLPPISDRSLGKELLRVWVLEHAEDEEDAGKRTSEEQWEAAVKELYGKEELVNHPEIFAYQMRAHWKEIGMDATPADEMVLVGDILRARAASGEKGMEKEAESKYRGARYKGIPLRIKEPDRFIAWLEGEIVKGRETHPSLSKRIRTNEASLVCAPILHTADGSTYVHQWVYIIKITGPDIDVWGDPTTKTYQAVWQFEPDGSAYVRSGAFTLFGPKGGGDMGWTPLFLRKGERRNERVW